MLVGLFNVIARCIVRTVIYFGAVHAWCTLSCNIITRKPNHNDPHIPIISLRTITYSCRLYIWQVNLITLGFSLQLGLNATPMQPVRGAAPALVSELALS